MVLALEDDTRSTGTEPTGGTVADLVQRRKREGKSSASSPRSPYPHTGPIHRCAIEGAQPLPTRSGRGRVFLTVGSLQPALTTAPLRQTINMNATMIWVWRCVSRSAFRMSRPRLVACAWPRTTRRHGHGRCATSSAHRKRCGWSCCRNITDERERPTQGAGRRNRMRMEGPFRAGSAVGRVRPAPVL